MQTGSLVARLITLTPLGASLPLRGLQQPGSGPPCPVWASRPQEHSPEPRRARRPPTLRAQAALLRPSTAPAGPSGSLFHSDDVLYFVAAGSSSPRSVQRRAKLSGAPILLPDLEGTKLSNFQESSPLPHKHERKDKRSTPEEKGRSAPEKIIQSLKFAQI
uniref:Uncharacterized protein n=2 Tax=Pongo abelii TaxID=9601 RepID=A0A8I5TLQ2_PONAB